MATFGKIMLALFIFGFWLFLPFGMQLFEVDGYNYLGNLKKENVDFELAECGEGQLICSTLNFFNWSSDILKAIGIYVKMMFFSIPSAIGIVKYFINFLQFASVIVIMVMLRGN